MIEANTIKVIIPLSMNPYIKSKNPNRGHPKIVKGVQRIPAHGMSEEFKVHV